MTFTKVNRDQTTVKSRVNIKLFLGEKKQCTQTIQFYVFCGSEKNLDKFNLKDFLRVVFGLGNSFSENPAIKSGT